MITLAGTIVIAIAASMILGGLANIWEDHKAVRRRRSK